MSGVAGAGQEPPLSGVSQRGAARFPLLGERARVRASLITNCIVPARILSVFLSLPLLCSGATQNPSRPKLPPETSFNQSAGRGDWVRIHLHLENGKEISWVTPDTGGYHTVLDKSLEPMLGKRLGIGIWIEPFLGGLVKVGLYKAPKLYLGDTQLSTGARVYTYDLQKESPGLMGILGMDCLRNYCVQFDFVHQKMRFLNPDHPGDQDLGKSLPLTIIWGQVIARADCFGTGKVFFCPDTGCQGCDAMLAPRLLRRISKKQEPVWSEQLAGAKHSPKMALFSKGVFGGETYTNLTFLEWRVTWPAFNLVGLPFLARNLVTFNFPKRLMYLKQESVEPLNAGFFIMLDAEKFLFDLAGKGQLPGWSKDDRGQFSGPVPAEVYPFSETFAVRKFGDPTVYHYTVVRETKESSWKLQKAWRTGVNGHLVKDYPIP
jgi:hypothetical protein